MFGKDSESKDIVKTTAEPSQFMQMIEKIANNPKIDADTVEKFLDMQERILDRDAKTAFYGAMNIVQGQIETVIPDRYNLQTGSDYASLQAIDAAIKPVYTAQGFSVSFWQSKPETEGFIRVEGVLRHRDGHSEPYHLELPPDKAGIKGAVNKTDVHAAASTFNYARRYLTCMTCMSRYLTCIGHTPDLYGLYGLYT